ncbi:MAG: YvrJ family protein [Synergistaceae bacterium]|nr:YvrJ family protein [Synergistaceae bacterium]
MESFLQGSFAIAVAAFLLIRMEHQLAALTQAIALLRHCRTCRLSPDAHADVRGGDRE